MTLDCDKPGSNLRSERNGVKEEVERDGVCIVRYIDEYKDRMCVCNTNHNATFAVGKGNQPRGEDVLFSILLG